jgi:hypothetical protein
MGDDAPLTDWYLDWAIRLSLGVLVLAVLVSLAGIFFNDVLLPDETEQAVSEGVGWDVVTLVIAVPLLAASMHRSSKGSTKARLVWIGVLFYLVYTYGSYGMAYSINRLFLAYVALVALPLLAMGLLLLRLEPGRFKPDMSRRTMRYLPHAFYAFAAFIALLWLPDILQATVSGETPDRVVEAGFRTHVIAMLDYSLLVPLCLLVAAMLGRGDPWGLALAPIVLIKFVTLAAAILAMLAASFAADVSASAPAVVIFSAMLGITLYLAVSYFKGLDVLPPAGAPSGTTSTSDGAIAPVEGMA